MKLWPGSLIVLNLWVSVSFAGLGDREKIESTNSKAQVKSFPSYEIRELSETTGLVTREFVRSDRTVFGIAWEGRHLPDFSHILGTSFRDFEIASKSNSLRRGPLSVSTGNLVVFSGGRQRHFSGHAYLKHLIPSDLPTEIIR